ncbi:MAG: hypothetical protein ACR2N4_02345 [Jatrophihabitans sp.]
MRLRPLATTGALVLTLGGLLGPAGPAAADDADCYGHDTHPDVTHSGTTAFGDGTAIRRGPYTDCDAFGRGYPSHGIDVHCRIQNSNNYTWVYLQDTTTGVAGWAIITNLHPTAAGTQINPC